MNRNLRKTVIAGNWKMNKTPAEAVALINDLKAVSENKKNCDIIVCVPFVDLPAAVEATKGTDIKVGAQNVHFEKSGAFTGEISADMLLELGVNYVIIGHSERRQYFGETDDTVNLRVKAAVNAGLTVILCIGELLGEREDGITAEILSMQTKKALKGLTAEQMKKIIIAYEPVWAIGTGKTATSDQADEACLIVRNTVAGLFGQEVADATTIQYGGSMNAGNAAELLSKENVDGGLIGGASLKAADFGVIIDAAQ
ncbi:MAG: triose-phosphate isomerase [Ruminococcaceae bacterium]|nr:triose-phosphate isomerase [Oscillospiraceae bacterium]